MTWQTKAAALLRDRGEFPTSGLRGMVKVAERDGNEEMAELYRAEIARRRAEDKQAHS
jgi:hypothetical protein